MKKFFIVFLFLICALFFEKSLAANTDIIINEIGAYPASTHEWIEIWNKGNEPIDLIGWKFWENNSNHGLSVSTTDSIVSANEYAVIVQDAEQFILDYPSFGGSVFDSSFVLNESGESVGLKDSDGNFIEQFAYVSAANFSLERQNPFLADYTNVNWQEHASGNTVGAVNSNFLIVSTPVVENTSTTATSTFSSSTSIIWSNLKINEFVSDPDSGNEWVELFNPATSSLDVSEGYICDSRNTTSTCKVISGVISANDWLKIDLLTESFLNNTGDAVILKNPDGNIIDQIVYDEDSAPDKGQSLARSIDGTGEWAMTTQITSGTANVIIAPVLPQTSSGSGGGSNGGSGFNSNDPVSSVATSSKKTTVTKSAAVKEKVIGLNWKIKYNLRLRQHEENIFDAAKSIDPRGGRIEYGWNFNNQIVSGANVKYAFATSGKQQIVVRATSTAGTVDEKKITVIVYPDTENAGAGIIFSEILPRASAAENEYIRLKNISNQVVNMSNWKLVYKNYVYEIPTSTFLAANDFLTFYQPITGFTLNNSGAQLLLLNQEDILIDEMEYGKADENVEYMFNGEKWNWAMPTTSAKVIAEKINSATKKVSGRFFTGIAEARAGQKGDWARVTGVVAVLPGIFGSQYFYLTNGNAGMQIYQNKKDFPPLEVGDSVQVYGTISEASGIKRINVKSKNDIDILSTDNTISSTELNADEIDESLAGGLVRIEGEVTEIKSNFMYLDNGTGETVVYFKQGAKINKTKFKEGENVRVMGILEQTKTGWQIWPRSAGDIESLGPSADLLQKEASTSENVGDGATEKYLTATAGGVTTLILAFLARARGALMLGGIKRVGLLAAGFIKKNKS